MNASPDSALLRACASAFTGRSSRLGRKLHEGGHAHIEGADDATVIIRVDEDEQTYVVGFSFAEVASRSRLQVQCECSFFRDGFRCEHLYAGLLTIESSGLNMVAPHYLEDRLDLVVMREDLRIGQDRFFQAGEDEPSPPTIELDWRQQLTALRRTGTADTGGPERALERGRPRDLRYRLLPGQSEERQALVIAVTELRPAEGAPEEQPVALSEQLSSRIGDPHDAQAIALLSGCPADTEGVVSVPPAWSEVVINALVATGRFCVSPDANPEPGAPIRWDEGAPWEARLELVPEAEEAWRMEACFQRGEELVPVRDPTLVLSEGLMLLDNRLCRLSDSARGGWLRYLRRAGEVHIPRADQAEAVRELCRIPGSPRLLLPGPWHFDRQPAAPQIRFERPRPRVPTVQAEVGFVYEGVVLTASAQQTGYVDEFQHRVVLRDAAGEIAALERLGQLGITASGPGRVELARGELDRVVRALTTEGWRVYAEGWQMRPVSHSQLSLASEQDWFELSGEFDFGGVRIGLPELLTAIADRGYVELDDGSRGLLPESWIGQYEALARLGRRKGKALRFSNAQATLVQALLDGRQELSLTPSFRALKERLQQAQTLRPQQEPEHFVGELRGYQREGLGWLRYLSELQLGGCLADDMGLGKTVQVLALLQWRKQTRRSDRPSLVVAPRSLVHNWVQEAARFVPQLKVLDYTGATRHEEADRFTEHDLVITTYGIVRRDTARLAACGFDYVILDEAQAIKNASSQVSQACRLLVGEHRLALSGTPIENRVAELWALFEFLTPGLLGSRAQFARLAQAEQPEALRLVGKALSPMILRRTKRQVLSELPEKTELTIYAELGAREREMYEELKQYYRQSLSKSFDEGGFANSKIQVLEALLRLRQAACHPGLVDAKWQASSSAKLDLLLEHLEEITAEGHKALVFSQFVQLLDILRRRLDADQRTYAYLDGRTRKREQEILRFSEDPDCSLFLISLRAGGVGLNLTAADYVFILDPWWNPAVEAQAIDRAHRIGQARPVFAYRIIARDTVEDKILTLQKRKTQLVDAILEQEQGGLRELTQEDLELLLA